MERDLEYEENNSAYDCQYREEDGGGIKCKKCGFDDYRALQIDHIDGMGSKDKHRIKAGPRVYLEHIKKNQQNYI